MDGSETRRPSGGRDAAPARPLDRGTRRFILLAALAGLLCRLGFGLVYWTGQPLTRDEREYLSLARSLAAGRGFVYDAPLQAGPVQPFGRAPGYPAFLAIAGPGPAPDDAVPVAVKAVQAIIGGAGVVLAAVLAGRIGGRPAARLTAAITAVYPPLVWIASYAYSEAIFWPLGLAIAWLCNRMLARRGAIGPAVWCGVATGAGVLIRPALIVFVAPVLAWLLVRRQGRTALAFGAVVALVLAPWTARNVRHYGRFVLVATEGGVTFWTGNNALAIGEGDMAANPAIKIASQALRARYPDRNEEAMEPVYYRQALAWIRANPGRWLVLEGRKLFYLVVPVGPSYTLHSARYFWASVVSYGVLLSLAIAGAGRAGRRLAAVPGVWLMAVSAVAVCLIFFPQERFRLPVLDPVFAICAGCVRIRTGEDARP
jgi:4-amino-4-deoxy-L-arabinose transferase-like glycosyltransferase